MKNKSQMEDVIGVKGFWLYERLDCCAHQNKVLILLCSFILPSIFVFSIPLVLRFSSIIDYTFWRIISLIIAASWSFWGPYFIYRYHVRVVCLYQKILDEDNKTEVTSIFQQVYKKNHGIEAILTIIWWAIVFPILILFPETLYGYSFYGFHDFWYYVFVGYILFILHLNACGFSGVLSSISLIKKLSKSSLMRIMIQKSPWNLRAMGQFSYYTTLYFFSGVAYIPILIDFIKSNNIYPQIGVVLSVGIFTFVCLVSFFVPVQIIKRNATACKEDLLKKAEAEYIKFSYKQLRSPKTVIKELKQLNIYNSIQFIQSIQINVIDSSKVFTMFTTLILPASIAILENWNTLNPLFQSVIHKLFIF